jgi:hypothetical protein
LTSTRSDVEEKRNQKRLRASNVDVSASNVPAGVKLATI